MLYKFIILSLAIFPLIMIFTEKHLKVQRQILKVYKYYLAFLALFVGIAIVVSGG